MRYYIVIGCLFLTGLTWSQKDLAEDYFSNFEFANYLSKVDKNAAEPEIKLRIAQAHYYLNDFVGAALAFKNVNFEGIDEVNYLYYVRSLKNSGSYDEANKVLSQYTLLFPDDKRAVLLKKQIEFAQKNKDQSDINITSVENANNGADQFYTNLVDGKLTFISEQIAEKSIQPNVDYSSKSNDDKLSYGNPVRPKSVLLQQIDGGAFSELISIPGFHITAAVKDPKSENWYLTLVEEVNKWDNFAQAFPRIYEYKSGGKPKLWNLKGLGVEDAYGQVAFSPDGKYVVLSVSKKTSKTASDLFVSERNENGNWSELKTLVGVNTFAEEGFPRFSGDSVLYFSSNGFDGWGGFDILKVKWTAGKIEGTPQVLVAPLNSFADEYDISFSDNYLESGYISSNRFGGQGDMDIYAFEKKKPWNVTVFIQSSNALTNDDRVDLKLDGVKVSLNDTWTKSTVLTLNQGNEYSFVLTTKDTFEKIILKLPNHSGIDTTIKFVLPKREVKPVEVVNNDVKENDPLTKTFTPETVFFEFDKFAITKNEKEKLKMLVAYLKEHPDKKVTIKTYADERGDVLYNIDLTTKRAKEIFKWLTANGITQNRINIQSLGEVEYDENCSPNCDEQTHSKYRRADFVIK